MLSDEVRQEALTAAWHALVPEPAVDDVDPAPHNITYKYMHIYIYIYIYVCIYGVTPPTSPDPPPVMSRVNSAAFHRGAYKRVHYNP